MTTRPRTIGDRLARDAETSFIGRDQELSKLQAAIEAPELPFAVAFLHGPGGIGKSSLIRAVCRLARPGVRAVVLDCRSIEPTPNGFLAALAAAFGGPDQDVSLETLVARVGATARRTVLALDTYETFGLMDAWLRQVFVPALPDNVLTVIAGREAPDAAWTTTPGWQDLFREIEIRELPEAAANQLLESRGLGAVQIERARRFARGHPLALELAAAALRTRPDLDLIDTAPARVLQQLTSAFLAGLPLETTAIVEAASTVRRVTEPLLAALLETDAVSVAFGRLRELAFVTATNEGFILHDVVRDTIAAELAQRAPERHRAYRRRAWEFFTAESRHAMARHLWQTTADMLYLIENPNIRQAFFPDGGRDYRVEPAVPDDGHGILAISASVEPPEAAAWIARWWRYHPEAFSVARGRDLSVAGFFVSFDPTTVTAEILAQDPLTASWLRDLQAHPVAGGERVLFLRRWLATRTGEAPSPIQAACWLDIKRSYMELRPSLRRLYTTVTGLTTYAPIVLPLRFRPLPEANVALGGRTYHTAVLDFGPGSVDGWLATVVGAELGVGPTSPESSQPADRHLTTVLFTDIVGATERALALGDAQWRALLERHHTLTRTLLARNHGREIDTAGDGFFATFDTPARAIRCALAIRDAVGQLGLTVRAGIHTGECETMGEKIAGIAVHVGARVCGRADPEEVLVTNTVKELVAGTDLSFQNRGHHALKGLPGDWLLFSAKAAPA
jgi:class 3 adenylate cyclase/ABC-type branched-subunit amino acid transport system ATPase component